MAALVSLDATAHVAENLFGRDRIPVEGGDVPLDGGQAEFAGSAKNKGPTSAMRRAEEADGRAEGIFKNSITTCQLLTDTSGRLPREPGMSHGVVADEVPGAGDGAGKVRTLTHEAADEEEGCVHLVVAENFEQPFRGSIVRPVVIGERNLIRVG